MVDRRTLDTKTTFICIDPPPLPAGLLGDKYGTHYEYCVNELTQSFRGAAAGGGGHTSGQYVTRLGSVLDFSKIFDDERKNLGF